MKDDSAFVEQLKQTMDGTSGDDYIKVVPSDIKGLTDMVNHPPHYTRGKIEAIEVIDAFFKDNYYLGQVFRYTSRAGFKFNEIEDLEKAKWYLDRYIEQRKEELK